MADNEERKHLLREQEDLVHHRYVSLRLNQILEPTARQELAAEETRWSLVLRLRELEDHYDACINILVNSVNALQRRVSDPREEDQLCIDGINRCREHRGMKPLPPLPTATNEEIKEYERQMEEWRRDQPHM